MADNFTAIGSTNPSRALDVSHLESVPGFEAQGSSPTHVCRDMEADLLFPAMGPAFVDHHAASQAIDQLTTSLFVTLKKTLEKRGSERPIPIIVLRGGLLMLSASRTVLGSGPWGFILPSTHSRDAMVKIQRADIPLATSDAPYVIADPIVNSGSTVLATMATLEKIEDVAWSLDKVKLACIFLTERGEKAIHERYPQIEIFTIWDQMSVEPNGWVTGVGFDAGECAMGGQDDRRLKWAIS